MSDTIPKYPDELKIDYRGMLLRLQEAVTRGTVARIAEVNCDIGEELKRYSRCDFVDERGMSCHSIAVTVAYGIPCCSDHAKRRAECFV